MVAKIVTKNGERFDPKEVQTIIVGRQELSIDEIITYGSSKMDDPLNGKVYLSSDEVTNAMKFALENNVGLVARRHQSDEKDKYELEFIFSSKVLSEELRTTQYRYGVEYKQGEYCKAILLVGIYNKETPTLENICLTGCDKAYVYSHLRKY